MSSNYGFCYGFTVPDGYRGVLRAYRYNLSPMIYNRSLTGSDITTKFVVGAPCDISGATIQTNGVDVPQYTGMQNGQGVEEFLPCYILVESGQTISLVGIFSTTYTNALAASLINNVFPNVEFYGQLLLSTGRPLTYEPGLATPVPVYNDPNYKRKQIEDLTRTLQGPQIVPATAPVSAPPLPNSSGKFQPSSHLPPNQRRITGRDLGRGMNRSTIKPMATTTRVK